MWTDPKIMSNYHELWQSIATRANLPGSITHDHAREVHVRWRSLGKKAQAGRL